VVRRDVECNRSGHRRRAAMSGEAGVQHVVSASR
jgi:hypothetical protein